MARDSSDGIATRLGLDGLGSESRWRRDFPNPSRLALGPTQLLYNGYWVSFPELKGPGLGVDHPLQSSADVKEIVELYLYSVSVTLWTVTGELSLDFYVNSSVVV